MTSACPRLPDPDLLLFLTRAGSFPSPGPLHPPCLSPEPSCSLGFAASSLPSRLFSHAALLEGTSLTILINSTVFSPSPYTVSFVPVAFLTRRPAVGYLERKFQAGRLFSVLFTP